MTYVSPEDFITLLALLCSETRYKIVQRKGRVKGGVFAGLGATVGGVCSGPVGAVIGGLVGGTVGTWTAKQTEISLEQFLIDMNKEQREDLFRYMRYLADDSKAKSFVGLNAEVATNWMLKRRYMDVFLCYLKNELKLTVVE
ncbi:predicted protein [Nematostella vectensis]|uniref:Uncharacterized protein n=1 Tax=Nematostella vectensis TaxID=45351 RepID=A7SGY2_NEMVE|nr:protein C19orf12 homolog [Nematostella vectensis]EDO37091.1 predicted protein [Nematostella vectensis]|eukprot:XP_001629154.1 predicted protein [Nematostella vectensis]